MSLKGYSAIRSFQETGAGRGDGFGKVFVLIGAPSSPTNLFSSHVHTGKAVGLSFLSGAGVR